MAELTALIRNSECQVRSLEDVLSKLPGSMTRNYVLYYKSRSIQAPYKTDYVHPRALLYTDGDLPNPVVNAHDLVLTFNGAISQALFHSIEIMQTNALATDPAQMIQFYSIDFPKEDQSQTWQQVQAQIQVSAANPVTCTICHGNVPRPLLTSFPQWEGAYGSFFGKISEDENKGLKDLRAAIAGDSQSRYRFLDFDQVAGSDTTALLDGRANAKLNSKLAQINALRVAELIQAAPDYAKKKYALMGALLDCPQYPEFFPPDLEAAMEEGWNTNADFDTKYADYKMPGFLARLMQAGYADFGEVGSLYPPATATDPTQRFWQNLLSYSGGSQRLGQVVVDTFLQQGANRTSGDIAKLRFALEWNGSGIYEWFMDPTPATYRETQARDIVPILEKDPDFAWISTNSGVCLALQEKSLQALSGK